MALKPKNTVINVNTTRIGIRYEKRTLSKIDAFSDIVVVNLNTYK